MIFDEDEFPFQSGFTVSSSNIVSNSITQQVTTPFSFYQWCRETPTPTTSQFSDVIGASYDTAPCVDSFAATPTSMHSPPRSQGKNQETILNNSSPHPLLVLFLLQFQPKTPLVNH